MSLHLFLRASRLAGLILLVTHLSNSVGQAHPFHSTFAEAEWNERTQRVEVAYRLRSYDLEQALRAFHDQPIDLEKTTDLPKLMKEYFAQTFYIESNAVNSNDGSDVVEEKRTRSTIHWVGHEYDEKAAWVYFELEPNGPLDNKRLVNRVLIDIMDEQSNVVELGMGHRVLTLQFDNRHSVRPIEKSLAKMRFTRSNRRQGSQAPPQRTSPRQSQNPPADQAQSGSRP